MQKIYSVQTVEAPRMYPIIFRALKALMTKSVVQVRANLQFTVSKLGLLRLPDRLPHVQLVVSVDKPFGLLSVQSAGR